MPRFSKPVVEDANGELIMPGAYGAAPGGVCERRSTFEWDNQGRTAPGPPLINVDDLSVDLSEDDDEERAARRTSSGDFQDEEMGSSQLDSQGQRRQSTNNNEDPSEHAMPGDLQDAVVLPAPLPTPAKFPLWAKLSRCSKQAISKSKWAHIVGLSLLVAVALILLAIWQQQNTTEPGPSFVAGDSPNNTADGLFDPPSSLLAFRGELGLQQVILQVLQNKTALLDPNWKSPYWEALYWILYEDTLQLTADDPLALQQRYLLAAFYFATSRPVAWPPTNGQYVRRLWTHCAHPTRPSMHATVVNTTSQKGGVFKYMQCTHPRLTKERPSLVFEPIADQWRWLSAVSECDWAGVECNSGGRVTALVLTNYGLTGTIPPQLGLLPNIDILSLPYNDHLMGSIPSGFFAKLKTFELQYNNHSGTLGALDDVNIRNAPLEILNLAGNQLAGSLPIAFEDMSNLRQVSLQENQFVGVLPTAAQWPLLELLRAQGNRFTGTIPPTLVANTNLRVLDLSSNQNLKGSIPSSIGLSTKLQSLGLAQAQLTGIVPDELYNCTKLKTLDLRENKLVGTMATEIGNLPELTGLFWQNNEFQGTLPSELGQLARLHEFHINGNNFKGAMPPEFCGNGFPLAHKAIVVVDCSSNDSEDPAVFCADGCCSECCQSSTGNCTTNPLAIIGYGTRTP